MALVRRHGRGILDRFILKEMAGPFIFGVMSFTMVFVAGDLLFQIASLIIEKGISLGVVVRLFLYRLPEVIILTLPMACLLSSLLTFGKLSANSELVALKASGIAFQRILRPVIWGAIIVGFAALILNETVVPFSNRAAENLMRYEVMREKPSLLQEQVFLRDESQGELNRVIYIEKLQPRKGTMSNILVQEFEKGKLRRITVGKTGLWKDGKWWLNDGEVYQVGETGKVELLFHFDRQHFELDLSPQQVEQASRKPKEMSATELLVHIRLLKAQGARLAPLWVMFHLKLAVPWASVVLAILGASLGVRSHRTGSGVGFGLSVVIVFVYYVVMSFCKALGETEHMMPFIAAWLPNVLFLLVGSFFARKAND
ncbi:MULTISPECIES: LptF/LptG family permease [Aminobacterium]|uniref:LptF/LptG family permease n=1 Tax=Aminobacterium TaxID=81466 RepID=UPI000464E7BD|nr:MULTISPECIES: LptF/LptG family permease [Aminobacterium]